MAKRSVRAYVELASGLGEMTRARAVEAAQELVTLAGAKGSSGKVAKQVEKLAGDLLGAAEQNRAHVVGLVQREVESAVARVDVTRLLTEVQALGATVAEDAVPAGAKVAVVARPAGPEHPVHEVLARLRTAGHRAVLVDCGWPRGGADVETWGASPAVARVLLAVLRGEVGR